MPSNARNAMSMFFDKRGQLGILHVMEFLWRGDRERGDGIGGTDAELIKQWPGLLFDNTADYVSWGVSSSHTLLPADVLRMDGAQLQETVLRDVMVGWHPTLRALVRDSDHLLGDAIHTMTPGRGAGANTALRDAALLRDVLVEVRDERTSLLAAIGDYEQRMRAYSAVAVEESLEFMNDGATARKPVIGPLTTFGMRTALRITDRIPALKRRMALSMQKVRDAELESA